MTSHDVVLRVRRVLGGKVGHTGTLDPQATGVLILCIGAATRLARFLQHQDKAYDCVVRFGQATDTYDAEGQPVAEADKHRRAKENPRVEQLQRIEDQPRRQPGKGHDAPRQYHPQNPHPRRDSPGNEAAGKEPHRDRPDAQPQHRR